MVEAMLPIGAGIVVAPAVHDLWRETPSSKRA